jgi:hypothetical protein
MADFFGTASDSYGGEAFLRLRTAHADLQWKKTSLFFAYDRPILSPRAPTSLTAVALPALSWSGNLWSWNPQFGLTHDFSFAKGTARAEFALMDVSDPPSYAASSIAGLSTANTSELSRKPAVEGRLSWRGGDEERSPAIGVGGYYAAHRSPTGARGESWAATFDYHLPLPAHLQWTGNIYRGQGLGGLGAGGYKDYLYRAASGVGYVRWFEDVGGWSQLKQKINDRVEWNLAYGIDNVFAGQLRPFVTSSSSFYNALARNRTFTGNVIYSPRAYLLFSVEYRHIQTSPVSAKTHSTDVVGAAAAYRF